MSRCAICASLDKVPDEIHKMIQAQILSADQRTEQWYKQRASMVTASDVAAIICENFFSSAADILYKKLAAITGEYGDLIPFRGNAATEWGTKQEAYALEAFCERTGHKVVNTGLLGHTTLPFLGGSPDGITWCGAILEIKCPYKAKICNIRSVPRHYYPQVQTLLEITQLERAYFVQFRPAGYGCEGKPTLGEPERFTLLDVKRDRDWAAQHLPTLEKFYHDLQRLVQTHEQSLFEDEN